MKISELSFGDKLTPKMTARNRVNYFETLKTWAVKTENGMKTIDYSMFDIYATIFAVEIFGEIEMDTLYNGGMTLENIFDTYDLICDKLPEFVGAQFAFFVIEDVINSINQDIKIENSIGSIIKNIIDKIDIQKMSEYLKDAPEVLKKLNPDTLEVLLGVMEKNDKK